MADAAAEAEVIDLTDSSSEEASAAAASATATASDAASSTKSVTPDRPTTDRPTKRVRVSLRQKARREQEEEEKKLSASKVKCGDDGVTKEEVDDTPMYEAANNVDDGNHTNGYFEVDEILDRRTRKYGSENAGLRHVVEYCKFYVMDFVV